ncbi:hypothetical protein PZH32_11400, partial [Adlercreutzia equolifaciens]|uniref:hypothetical protein n=1 Tax=Adlercreutzia equolifaciens TaxID=446660 RepID=UPI0023B19CBA
IYTAYTTKLYNAIDGTLKNVADESYDSMVPNGDSFRVAESTVVYTYDDEGGYVADTRESQSIGRIFRLEPELGWQYEADVLDVFGMLNDWVTHETIFAPTEETEAWQYYVVAVPAGVLGLVAVEALAGEVATHPAQVAHAEGGSGA